MSFRRIAAAALVAAVALMPLSGHAILEEKRQVPGSACTIGDSSLTFNSVSGQWIGAANLDCRDGSGEPANQIGLSLNFVLHQIQGVNTFQPPYLTGPVAMTSQADPFNPAATTFSCGSCPSIQAQGTRATLTPGLYIMNVQGTVQQAVLLRRGSHTTCFLVRGDIEGEADAIPGCTP
ncbi:MAG TPA: hypothetical protein VGB64_09440 [Actinomycetota bacterium]